MWARTVEIMLGLWLAASPFIFRHARDAIALWWTDLGCTFLILVFSSLAFSRRASRAHFLNLLIAGWLIGSAYVTAPYPVPPAAQNHIILGLILAMIALIPNEAAHGEGGRGRELVRGERAAS